VTSKKSDFGIRRMILKERKGNRSKLSTLRYKVRLQSNLVSDKRQRRVVRCQASSLPVPRRGRLGLLVNLICAFSAAYLTILIGRWILSNRAGFDVSDRP
jgi:hypothetical protein